MLDVTDRDGGDVRRARRLPDTLPLTGPEHHLHSTTTRPAIVRDPGADRFCVSSASLSAVGGECSCTCVLLLFSRFSLLLVSLFSKIKKKVFFFGFVVLAFEGLVVLGRSREGQTRTKEGGTGPVGA